MTKKTGALSGANLGFLWRSYARKTLMRSLTENTMHLLFSKQDFFFLSQLKFLIKSKELLLEGVLLYNDTPKEVICLTYNNLG